MNGRGSICRHIVRVVEEKSVGPGPTLRRNVVLLYTAHIECSPRVINVGNIKAHTDSSIHYACTSRGQAMRCAVESVGTG